MMCMMIIVNDHDDVHTIATDFASASAFVSLATTTATRRSKSEQQQQQQQQQYNRRNSASISLLLLPPLKYSTGTKLRAISEEDDDSAAEHLINTTAIVRWRSTMIEFNHVCKSYGELSLWTKLTSSVPRREFALDDVSVKFCSSGRGGQEKEGKKDNRHANNNINNNNDAIYLLLGASSSGKSTILKSIIEEDEEKMQQQNGKQLKSGSIRIRVLPTTNQNWVRENEQTTRTKTSITSFDGTASEGGVGGNKNCSSSSTMMMGSKPMLLDDRNEVKYTVNNNDQQTTVRSKWTGLIGHELDNSNSDCQQQDQNHQQQQQMLSSPITQLIVDIMTKNIFDLNPNQLISTMTPSEKYRFCLGEACIRSSISRMQISSTMPTTTTATTCAATRTINNVDNNKNVTGNDEEKEMLVFDIPGPILLLDEWMDVETGTVVQKVQPSLHKIVQKLQGIVISVTHKPNLYSSSSSGGRICNTDDISSNSSSSTSSSSSTKQCGVVRKITLSGGKILSST